MIDKKTEEEQEKNMKELGLVVATKEEALWKKVKTATEQRIKELEDDLTINREMLKLAEAKSSSITGSEKS